MANPPTQALGPFPPRTNSPASLDIAERKLPPLRFLNVADLVPALLGFLLNLAIELLYQTILAALFRLPQRRAQ